MLWIGDRRDEPIPQELYYDEYKLIRNNNGQTPLMLWIEWR